MSLSAQQLAAQKNISWVLAEKLAQKNTDWRISAGKHSSRRNGVGGAVRRKPYRRPRSGEDAYCKRHAAAPPSHWHPGDAAQQLEFP